MSNLGGSWLLKTDARPLYHHLKERLRAEITSGHLKPDEAVPSERELSEHFRISRATARKALEELAQEGLVVRQQGRGTYVRLPKVEQQLVDIRSFVHEMTLKGLKPESRILEISQVLAGPEVAKRLSLLPEAFVHKVVRLQLINKQPWASAVIYLPRVVTEPQDGGSLVSTIEDWLNVQYEKESRRVNVSLELSVAGELEAQTLHLSRGAPVFLAQWTISGRDGPLEFARVAYRADLTRFVIRMRGRSGKRR